MVDATTAFDRDPSSKSSARVERNGSAVTVSVVIADAPALAAYARAAGDALTAPAQSAEWVRAWVDNAASDCVIATISRDNAPVLALALEIVRLGPVGVARFMGGRHANGNFPAGARAALAKVSAAEIRTLSAELCRVRPDVDLLHLERLADQIDGLTNPLLRLDHRQSPNYALAVDLSGGFDAVLGRTSGKRKRKKHRSQTRKFEAAGGFRRIEAKTPGEIDRLLGAFFEMKQQRLLKMGVSDVFGAPTVRAFFAALFKEAAKSEAPRFVLHGLEVAGKLRAVTGSSRCGARLICEFGAIVEDDMAHASPGDFLFFDNIREAADAGMTLYDFSVGDEPYKRLWCDTEIVQFDVLLPMSAKGRVYAGLLRLASTLKSRIKNNATLWRLVKRVRRQKVAPTAPADPED